MKATVSARTTLREARWEPAAGRATPQLQTSSQKARRSLQSLSTRVIRPDSGLGSVHDQSILGNRAIDLPRRVRNIRRRSTVCDRNHRTTRTERATYSQPIRKTSGGRGRLRFFEPDARQATAMLNNLDDAINQWRCLSSIRVTHHHGGSELILRSRKVSATAELNNCRILDDGRR